jgi:TolA-binding protein
MKYLSTIILLITFSACQSAKEKLEIEIKNGESKLFGDSVKEMDKNIANEVFKNYLHYADTYKEDTSSAAYLFKAADLSNGLGRPMEAIKIYERMRNIYPDYRKSPAALFMQGFIYETAVQDKESAKEKYREFIQIYPDHTLVPSAQASLDQLNANLSDEELIKSFEAKNGK